MAEYGSEGHTIGTRAGLGLFLGLDDVAADKVGQIKSFVLKNAPNQENIKIRYIIATTGAG